MLFQLVCSTNDCLSGFSFCTNNCLLGFLFWTAAAYTFSVMEQCLKVRFILTIIFSGWYFLRYFFLSSKLFTIDTNLLFKKKKTWIFLCHGLNPESFWLWLECVICQSRILTILLCENFASSLLWTICNQLTFLHLILYLFKFPVLHFSEFKFWFKTWPVMNFLATAHYYHHHYYYCRHFAIAYI